MRPNALLPLLAAGALLANIAAQTPYYRGGDVLVANDRSGPALYLVKSNSVIQPVPVSVPLSGLAFLANGDLAIIDGFNDDIYKLDRMTSQLSVFVNKAALGNNPDSITETGDGGFLVALESTTFGFSGVHIDSLGAVSTLASNGPFTNLEEVAVVPTFTGPTGLATGPGAVYALGLEVPNQPNALYFLGMAVSIFPGVGLPNDPRGLTVNPDGLFMAILTGGVPIGFVRWRGITDGSGAVTNVLRFDFR